MSVLVDTSIWSLVLRRPKHRLRAAEESLVREWTRLLRNRQVRIIGPIRQEILSGIRSQEQFDKLRTRLAAFPDMAIEPPDYEAAASMCNRCRARGITGGAIDLLICAAATRLQLAIFTTDADFHSYAAVLPLRLHTPGT